MSVVDQYADYIVLAILTVAAFGLLMLSLHLHRKHERNKRRSIDVFFENNTYADDDEHGNVEATVTALLSQAIAGTQQAARTIRKTEARLEAIRARIGRLEATAGNPRPPDPIKDSNRPSDVPK